MVSLNINELNQIESGASKKKIYRFKNESKKKILVDFSYNFSDYLSFINVHKYLSNINISIPKIFETSDIEKLILMEDFGNDRYDKIINNYDVKQLLVNAIDSLLVIQNFDKPLKTDGFKQYNYSTFKEEIIEFVDSYLPILKTSSDQIEEFLQIWKSEFEKFNFNWNSFVHKDFELSNLMYLPHKENHLKCGILDFQNAFIGFSGWDLFSLLENPRVDFDEKYNKDLIEYFYNNSNQRVSYKDFLKQYLFLNTARQTRILGRWVNLDEKNNNNYYKSNFHAVTIKRLKNSLFNLQNTQLNNLYKIILKNEKF